MHMYICAHINKELCKPKITYLTPWGASALTCTSKVILSSATKPLLGSKSSWVQTIRFLKLNTSGKPLFIASTHLTVRTLALKQ